MHGQTWLSITPFCQAWTPVGEYGGKRAGSWLGNDVASTPRCSQLAWQPWTGHLPNTTLSPSVLRCSSVSLKRGDFIRLPELLPTVFVWKSLCTDGTVLLFLGLCPAQHQQDTFCSVNSFPGCALTLQEEPGTVTSMILSRGSWGLCQLLWEPLDYSL